MDERDWKAMNRWSQEGLCREKKRREKPKQTFGMTKKQKLRVFGTLGTPILMYLIFVFCLWNWNPSTWLGSERFLLVFFSCVFMRIVNAFISIEIDER